MNTLTEANSAARKLEVPSTDISNLPFTKFVWGSGLECSFIPHLNVDQFDWTQHNRFWREDFKRAKEELGITHLRYALPWHKLETSPGQFDWSFADERIEECEKLGITLMMDVMHFGTPLWLKQAVGDPEFPEALERFTAALVTRYRSTIKYWCPFNEPLVSALFSGDLFLAAARAQVARVHAGAVAHRAGRFARNSSNPPRDAGGDRFALRCRREFQGA